jgi:hypothetical protein
MMDRSDTTQTWLSDRLGVSQPTVSHMLSTRSYGLTVGEIVAIEHVCHVPAGSLLHQLADQFGTGSAPSLEEQVYAIEGITNQAAAAIVGAIAAVRSDVLRRRGGSDG